MPEFLLLIQWAIFYDFTQSRNPVPETPAQQADRPVSPKDHSIGAKRIHCAVRWSQAALRLTPLLQETATV